MNTPHTELAQVPEISILMTAYNTARYIAEAIESILEQRTSRLWELLFVDDGSTDHSLGIACKYATRFPDRIFVFTHTDGNNQGISASRNLALKHARGPLLTFLDSDDVWLPHCLETQANILQSMPHLAMTYASAERWVHFNRAFNETASRAATWGDNYLPPLLPTGQPGGLLPRGALLRWFRADESLVPCVCTVMMRTVAARLVGGFCNEFRGLYDDQAFYAKLIPLHDVYAQDVCLARYRQHPESCCSRARKLSDEAKRERRRLLCKMSEVSRA